MTDIIEPAVSTSGGSARSAGISALRLPELQAMASELGVKGTSKMRKGDLVQAISDARGGSRPQALEPRRAEAVAVDRRPGAPHACAARRGVRTEAPQLDLGGETAPQQERPVRAPRGDALAGLEAALDAKLAPVEHRDDRAARAADAVGGVTGERRSRRAGRGAGAPQADEGERAASNGQQANGQQDRQQANGQQRDTQQQERPQREGQQGTRQQGGNAPQGTQQQGTQQRRGAGRGRARRARRSSSALARPLPRP